MGKAQFAKGGKGSPEEGQDKPFKPPFDKGEREAVRQLQSPPLGEGFSGLSDSLVRRI
jgi:hypothetical protein